MKFFMNCFVVFFVVGFCTSVFADTLFDAQGNLLPGHQIRCSTDMVDECGLMTDLAAKIGCLEPSEYSRAKSLGLAVVCWPMSPKIIAMACPCACFHKDTRILVSEPNDDSSWSRVDLITLDSNIISFTDETKVDNLNRQARGIDYMISDFEKEDLYVVYTGDYKPLSITQHHALLLSDGKMITAKNLKIGDNLIGEFGDVLSVQNILREHSSGKVFNLLLRSESYAGHLLVAEGIVSGDLIWKSMLDEEFNNVSLR